ncbi:MAG TPA: tRNA (adenosine(37)-N6)-threonylcarbamoyltransferase complex ATPase subunit type 1 TsaE [Gemmatimonadaceae bacterium]|nr:tRNA (adenosine(37)-N6)-threonylcarbamoyltransferase complex ATPase subunit type 1 TsaE [Gemmatimonadaceae bacterium]
METHRHVVPPLAAKGRLTLDENEMKKWGRDLGEALVPPLVLSLSGDLGAGKTTLTQAICEGYGVSESVTSPTYALVHRYDAEKSAVYHVDLYRLDNESQLTNIGWDDLLAERAIVIVEWPERAGNRMPDDHLHIDIEYLDGDAGRRVLLAG